MNGTSASTALASLALYETHHLAVLSQILSSIAVEALLGNWESFHPFIAQVRPHSGQIEVACNIRQFLEGSQLAKGTALEKERIMSSGLVQDRYALRTASQWIGPQLEDLVLADRQITTELNSTTDNPLVDVATGEVYSGGNFQAASVTSAMEKARLSLQMLGKLMFAQCTELINPVLNNGLPANLAADDPSLSFTMKGVDVNMASYMSELAFLANPVSSHVQSAEMHNQAVNSLALISARYTMHAVEITSLMAASFLYVGCQALDLRVMHLAFLQALRPVVHSLTVEVFGQILPQQSIDELQVELWKRIPQAWSSTTTLDAHKRFQQVVEKSTVVVVESLIQSQAAATSSMQPIAGLDIWKTRMLVVLHDTYTSTRSSFFERQNTAESLGQASKVLYRFVREELGVPFHTGLVEQPSPNDDPTVLIHGRAKKTIGSWISIIYDSLRSGRLHEPAMKCLGKEIGVNGS